MIAALAHLLSLPYSGAHLSATEASSLNAQESEFDHPSDGVESRVPSMAEASLLARAFQLWASEW